ncbi:MAG: FtsB family cell division protein [bacterium]
MLSLKRLFFEAILPAICVIGIGYNALLALNGDEGIRAHKLVIEKLEARQVDLNRLQRQRQELEQRATLLSSAGLDMDMLDESSRRVLGFAADGEYVISMQELDILLNQVSIVEAD